MSAPDQFKLKAFLSVSVDLTESDWTYFSERLKYIRFNKNDIISRAGYTENRLYFLIKGLVRILFNDANETIADFAFPGQFFSSYSSFISRSPSKYEIRPISEKVECFYIGYESLQDVYQNTTCGEKIGRLAAEHQFLKKSKREISLLSLTPRERYMQLLQEQAHFIQTIPLKHLASYLGITPETLSRIRASIS